MAITNVQKIIHLMPDAIFRNFEGEVVEWMDPRTQPTQAMLDALTDQEVLDKEGALDAQIESEKTSLPTRAQVMTVIDNIGDLADAKVFLKKLANVVYTLRKNSVN